MAQFLKKELPYCFLFETHYLLLLATNPLLKELYTSISTLAQKVGLTFLNNKFILKILNSTPFGRKIRKHFRTKNHKDRFFA